MRLLTAARGSRLTSFRLNLEVTVDCFAAPLYCLHFRTFSSYARAPFFNTRGSEARSQFVRCGMTTVFPVPVLDSVHIFMASDLWTDMWEFSHRGRGCLTVESINLLKCWNQFELKSKLIKVVVVRVNQSYLNLQLLFWKKPSIPTTWPFWWPSELRQTHPTCRFLLAIVFAPTPHATFDYSQLQLQLFACSVIQPRGIDLIKSDLHYLRASRPKKWRGHPTGDHPRRVPGLGSPVDPFGQKEVRVSPNSSNNYDNYEHAVFLEVRPKFALWVLFHVYHIP